MMTKPTSLAEALLAFQADPPHIALDGTNPHFKSKFATLGGVTEAIRPALNAVGLSYAQPLSNLDGAPAIATIVMHAATGDRIEATTPLLLGGKSDPQSHGSAITYARRYGLLSILGLVGDEDDDGNAATTKAAQTSGAGSDRSSGPTAPPPTDSDIPFGEEPAEQTTFVPPSGGEITASQLKFLRTLAEKLIKAEKLTVEAFRAELDASFGVTSTKALTKAQASEEIESLKKRAVNEGLIEG